MAESCIIAVEESRIRLDDEELGRCGIHVISVARHGDDAPYMGYIIRNAVICKLSRDRLIGASHSGAFRVASLYHESVHDPVESKTVVEPALGKVYKIGDRDRRGIGIELD